jgi:putative ABC transport system ATP-binding protein
MSEQKPVQAVIEMRGVSVVAMKNPDVVTTENVTWTVNEGDYWAIGGLHGAGKSDLLMMAGGITAPKSGSYFLFGEEMPIFDDARLEHRLRLGLVFDSGQLFNRLTVAENIALPLQYHRSESAEEILNHAMDILRATELIEWANSTPSAMSRNWQRRVGLARALALRPEVLLLDNPLGGLDWRHANWWLGFLDQLSRGHPLMNNKPTTLVVTADNLRPWQGYARQFAFLREKEFVTLGDRSQLNLPNEPLLKELLSEPAIPS